MDPEHCMLKITFKIIYASSKATSQLSLHLGLQVLHLHMYAAMHHTL